MSKPAVIIVGADKGGVGKTTITRTLLDYFSARKVPTRAFDTESPKGTLKRFHPDVTDVGHVTFSVFHILGPSIASLDEIADTADYLSDAKYFLVKNFINNTHFFEWDQATYNSYFRRIKDAVEITIPKLNEMASEQVELASVPFLSFIATKGQTGENAAYSFVLRGCARHWLGHVWAEYDRIKLVDIVSPKDQVQIRVAR